MPRCLPIEANAACLSCSRTRTSPLGPCEIWGIAAAMSGSISSLGTMLTRGRSTRVTWTTPSSPLRTSSSSRATISLRQATALRMSLKPIFASSHKTCSTVTSARSAPRRGISEILAQPQYSSVGANRWFRRRARSCSADKPSDRRLRHCRHWTHRRMPHAPPFFDVEDEFQVKVDLWLTASISIELMDLLYGVNKGRDVVKFIPNFESDLHQFHQRNSALLREMQSTERYKRAFAMMQNLSE